MIERDDAIDTDLPPLAEPCPHHTPNAYGAVASELHGVCIFCWRDRAGEARRGLLRAREQLAARNEICEMFRLRLERVVTERGRDFDRLRADLDAARAQIAKLTESRYRTLAGIETAMVECTKETLEALHDEIVREDGET